MKKLKILLSFSIITVLLSISQNSFSQNYYYSIEGTWQSTSGSRFSVKYTWDNYGNPNGLYIVNLSRNVSFYAQKITLTYYSVTLYDNARSYITYYQINNCSSITVKDGYNTNYWKKLY